MAETRDESDLTTSEATATAVIYLRVSSVGQYKKGNDPEGYSIPGQREACRLHAERLGAAVIREYVEPGKSGTSTKRPALQQMLSDLVDMSSTYVIVYDLSRVARDDFDALWLLREIEGRGCKLESTLERVDDTPAGKLLYTVMAGVNAFRSRGDAEKVKMGLRRKHSQGGTPGAAPIGYCNVRHVDSGREIRTIEVDPERAPLIRTAFELYATGQHSVFSLTDILESMSLRTLATHKRPSRPMGRSAVHRMLSNDYYVGVVTMKGQKAQGVHPAIVDLQTFERVQQLLRSRAQSGTRSRKHEHYLKGSLYCDVCGGRMLYVEAKGHGGTYEYFRCFGRFNAGKD
jgi:site-specific DNA recombinase